MICSGAARFSSDVNNRMKRGIVSQSFQRMRQFLFRDKENNDRVSNIAANLGCFSKR
jgi:hypothetical protein